MSKESKEEPKKYPFPLGEIIKYEGDEYSPYNGGFKHLPRITGLSEIFYEWARPFYVPRWRTWSYVMAPKSCYYSKLINYPFRRMGGPQISIVGTYGSGKSNLMNNFLAYYLARNIRVLMFNDRRFEARNLAAHGYYDKNKVFHPFQIDCFIPYGYKFKKANPLWNHRKNVHKIEYGSITEIIESMKPHRLSVVYDECFETAGKIALWIDIMQTLAEETTPSKNYMFSHHELSSLIPEIPTQDIYHLTRKAADVALNLRKDRIGMMTTFHMPSEVYYRVSQKFGYVCFKTPVNRQGMYGPEKDAKRLSIGGVNISKAGRWMMHRFHMYPEMADEYRLIPTRTKLSYPDLNPIEDSDKQTVMDQLLSDPINLDIMRMLAQGLKYRTIADKLGMSHSTIHDRAKKMGLTKVKD